MIYVVTIGWDYEGYSIPSYAGTNEQKARQVVDAISTKGHWYQDTIVLVTYNEDGEEISREEW